MTEYLYTKRTLFIGSGLMAILIFKGLSKTKFDSWLVKPCLALVESTTSNDLILLILVVIVLLTTWHYLKENILLHPDWILGSFFILVIYEYCCINHTYILIPFHTFSFLNYSDIIFLLIACLWTIKIRGEMRSHISPEYGDSPFLVDTPIKSSSGDLLNRKKFAERIARKIQSKPNQDDSGALAIGITGEWGSGKTSFSNMIVEALDEDNRIIIHFNPWRSSNAQKIIEDFFELLIAELKKHDSTLSANIYSYAKTLTKIDENVITKTLQALNELFAGSNKNEAYISINKSITDIKKQLIIFIDDLDRLDKLEIIEVLRIIRNTANFNNVVYLVSYDKGYILEAVKAFNEYNYQSFLEKIFQFEFALPMYESGIIRKYLNGLLKDALPQVLHDQVDSVIDSNLHKGINFTNEIIRTHREAIRLANSILFEITGIENDVFFNDFYLLQLIKLQYPFVYRGLIEYKQLFFINEPVDNDKILRFRLEHERALDENTLGLMRAYSFGITNDRPMDEDKKVPIFHRFLTENKVKFALKEQDIVLIKEVFDELLDTKRQISIAYKNEGYKAFMRAENFYKYFAFDLMEGEIPSIEFEAARLGDFDAYTEQVNKWIKEGRWQAFQDRLFKIEDFSDRHEFENHVRALFESGKVYSKSDSPYRFNYKHLIKILNFPVGETEKTPIKLYDTYEQYREFLRGVLNDEGLDKKFEARLLQMIIDHEQSFVLSFEELASISLSYLTNYLASDGPLNDDFWILLRSARTRTEDGYRGKQNPEAHRVGTEYYLSHVSDCELGALISQVDPESKYYYFDPDTWQNYFKTLEEFKSWMENTPQLDRNSACYIEFNDFFEKMAGNGFKSIIYDFKFLTPVRWRNT